MSYVMIDRTNQKFGKLTVKKFIRREKRKKRTVFIWEVECDCGTLKEIDLSDVVSGGTKSCGCYTKKFQSERRIKPAGVAAFNGLYASYRRTCAASRNLCFKLTKDEFKCLITSNCYYCDKLPSQIKRSKLSYFVYNGVDRVDNTKGYSIDNCVAACKECNSLKSGITIPIVLKMAEFFLKTKNSIK